MTGLTLNSGGTNRTFRPDGKVVLADASGIETVKGEWNSAGAREVNRIHYDFDGVEAEFDVRYEFNENNQLVAIIPAAANNGSDSEPFAFLGRIVVDDRQDVTYELMDANGVPTGETIVVHGSLAIADGLDRMTVNLAGGGTTQILGDTEGRNNVEPAPSAVSGGAGDQVLFSATTFNTFAGIEIATRAVILFIGTWGVNEKGLFFSAGLQSDKVAIQFGGTFKGVTAGLAYYAKDGSEEIAFTIHGEHRFQRPLGGEGSVNWLLTLGHSKTRIDAVASVGVNLVGKGGNKLTIDGQFHFVKMPGEKQVDFSLAAAYEMQGSKLVFAADFKNDGSRSSYNLRLEGKYKIRNGNVNFLVKLGRKDNQNTIDVALGSTFESQNLAAHINAVLSKTGSGKTSLSLNFDIRARWVNGELMKFEKPQMVT